MWGGLSTSKRVGLIAVTLAATSCLFLLMLWGGSPNYRILFSNLSQEDAASIVERLRERKVLYQLSGGGSVIEVPEEDLYDLRLALATEGLPQGGGVGFELFDRSAFGATEFVQRVNMQRALQGELSRTVRQFPQVALARVHLSLPERSLFVREETQPRATVVVQLKAGATLQNAQLQGIVHLVASSVQGMKPESVHVVDTTGKVLFSPKDGQSVEAMPGNIMELQREMESRIEDKIRDILEPVVGPQKVVARVHVDLDTRRVEQTEEQFDPDKAAVRSEQRTSEKSSGGGLAAVGVPGVMSNLPDQAESTSEQGSPSKYQRDNETVNYEVNRLTRRTIAPMGEIRRLTLAVLVDGVRKKVTGGNGQEVWEVVPRSAEGLKQYEEIVKQAVGFNPSRGDQLQVASAPFEKIQETIETQPVGWDQIMRDWIGTPLARYGLILLLSLLLILVVIRPLVRGILNAIQHPTYHLDFQGKVGELEGEGASPDAGPRALDSKALSTELANMAQADPERFAAVLRAWMRQEE
jgi:flagellar M-ring protein FliF